ncbi:hypothetical protein [Saccharophagus sp. K07]|uniref:hypothetical protein n=1 Tax=Saccharophagus sp. K07 TaxID=2283636 RepID=UPI001652739D|nr:hypothetical protein [Saccharophagus sp. K07]
MSQALEHFWAKGVLCLFFGVSILCFISPVQTGLDTQPYYLILSFLVFILYHQTKFDKCMAALLLVLVSGVPLYILAIWEANIRSFIIYISIFPLVFSMYRIFLYDGWKERYVMCFVFLYFGAAILQIIYGKDLFGGILQSRTTENRGVSSLANEPTLYALMCLLVGLICHISRFPKRTKIIIYVLLLLQIVFLARSSMALLVLVFWLFMYVLIVNPISAFYFLVVGAGIAWVVIGILPEDSRIFSLFRIILDSPLFLIQKDASVNERIAHLVLPVYASFDNYLFPQGFSSFSNVLGRRDELFGGVFFWGPNTNKIMSGFGAVLWEMGVVGLAVLFCFAWSCLSAAHLQVRDRLFLLAASLSLMFTAIPIINPVFCALWGAIEADKIRYER